MNRLLLGVFNRSTLVNRVASDVHDAAKSTRANWDHDWGTGVGSLTPSNETLRTLGIFISASTPA